MLLFLTPEEPPSPYLYVVFHAGPRECLDLIAWLLSVRWWSRYVLIWFIQAKCFTVFTLGYGLHSGSMFFFLAADSCKWNLSELKWIQAFGFFVGVLKVSPIWLIHFLLPCLTVLICCPFIVELGLGKRLAQMEMKACFLAPHSYSNNTDVWAFF